jgi:hypothetical protein
MHNSPMIRLAILVVVCVALVTACDDTTSPGVQPEISNVVDNFQYQVTDIRNYSHVDNYTWQNTGTTANVNQSTTITGGTATLVILDEDGVQVYSRSLGENGTFVTTAGASGSWTIRVTYAAASATVNFRVQKTT